MGFNTVVLLLNDQLSTIDKDPERFGLSLLRAINSSISQTDWPFSVGVGGAQILYQEHADSTGILAVGGNTGSLLGYAHGIRNNGSVENKIAILKQLADREGYYLSKKPRRKK